MITRFSKGRPKLHDIAGRTSTLLEIVNYNFEVSLLSAVYPTNLSAISV
jgi:hypothetical protein